MLGGRLIKAVIALEEYGKKDFPYYSRAIWQSKGSGFNVSYEEVGEDRYEIVYKTFFTIYARQAVVAYKGLNGSDFIKETKVEKINRSEIFMKKDKDGNYISEKYQNQTQSE